MTTISIVPEAESMRSKKFRAFAGLRNSSGNTPGEALDAISAQLGEEESGTMLVIQSMKPDRFFDAAQQRRLKELFDRWREARDTEASFPPQDQAELEALTMAELKASGLRAKALFEAAQQ